MCQAMPSLPPRSASTLAKPVPIAYTDIKKNIGIFHFKIERPQVAKRKKKITETEISYVGINDGVDWSL